MIDWKAGSLKVERLPFVVLAHPLREAFVVFGGRRRHHHEQRLDALHQTGIVRELLAVFVFFQFVEI